MTDTLDARPAAPWHLWLVVLIGVLWNGYGAYDFVMSMTGGEGYMREMGMTDAQIVHFNNMPTWMYVAWVMGVWGAVAGTVLLALRSHFAVHAFTVSLIGLIASLIYTFVLTNGREIMGQTVMIMQGVILVGCLFFLWYARTMAKRGVLR